MKLALLFIAALAAYAEELVEAKEIPAATVQAIKAADAEVDASVKALLLAQQAVLKSKSAKAALVQNVVSAASNIYEGTCFTLGDGYTVRTKKFRRASVSGKYVLVHEGIDECPRGITSFVGTDNSITLGTGTNWNGVAK